MRAVRQEAVATGSSASASAPWAGPVGSSSCMLQRFMRTHYQVKEALFGACRSSNSSTALVAVGRRWPKSCECWRQLVE